MSALIVGALATIGAALVAHLEFGGRRELREVTALIGAAAQLKKSDALRTRLLEDAAEAQTAYRRQVTLRPRLLIAVGLSISLFGVVLLFAAFASQPAAADVKTPYAVAVVAAVGFAVSLFGTALTSVGLLVQIWLARDAVRLVATVALVAIASAIVFFASVNLIDLPGFMAATSP
jgi:hypothetical protein